MRNIILVYIFISLSLCSCTDFLNIPIEDKAVTEGFFKTKEHAIQATNAMYLYQNSWAMTAYAPITLSVMSDNGEKGSTPSDNTFWNDFKNFKHTSSSTSLPDMWGGNFKGINYANQVITNVPAIEMDETLKKRLLAEAHFFRAYHYFNLVRTFGGVPIYDGLQDSYNIPRDSKDEVYEFIQKDFQIAADDLPTSYPDTDKGRATKGAALSFLAKTYLYQSNWAKVKELTDIVMTLGYGLYPDFYKMFRVEQENCIESIFEVSSKSMLDNGGGWMQSMSQVQGVRSSLDLGWGFNNPTQELVSSFEAGDKRKGGTVLEAGTTTPDGDKIPPYPTDAANKYFNYKAYVPYKYINGQGWPGGAEQNIRIMRYAEVLLMNAEANNELGNTSDAATSINKIRDRAGLTATTATTQVEMRQAIRKERRMELAMEYDRFFDLVRTGQAKAVLGTNGFVEGKNEILPIPQADITLSKGVIVQNPMY